MGDNTPEPVKNTGLAKGSQMSIAVLLNHWSNIPIQQMQGN
jgi:hypothetical protein